MYNTIPNAIRPRVRCEIVNSNLWLDLCANCFETKQIPTAPHHLIHYHDVNCILFDPFLYNFCGITNVCMIYNMVLLVEPVRQ